MTDTEKKAVKATAYIIILALVVGVLPFFVLGFVWVFVLMAAVGVIAFGVMTYAIIVSELER